MIGLKNTWIKFSDGYINFAALKKAFANYRFCVYTEKPMMTDRFIKGILIEAGDTGFLGGEDAQENIFVVDFSKDLNCVIGGRGTGKSTLLNMIETVFTMEVANLDQLKFICSHKMVYIIFHFHRPVRHLETTLIQHFSQKKHLKNHYKMKKESLYYLLIGFRYIKLKRILMEMEFLLKKLKKKSVINY